MRQKILFICTDPAYGMIPFATSIIKVIGSCRRFETYVIAVSKGKINYKPNLDGVLKSENIFHVSIPDNQILSLASKLYPIQIKRTIDYICTIHNIDIIHCLTTEFSLSFFLHHYQIKHKVIYTIHDFTPHEKNSKGIKEKIIDYIINKGVIKNTKTINNLTTSSINQLKNIKKKYPQKTVLFHHFPSLVTESIINGNSICPELNKKDNYILFFGNLDIYKGVELLYNVFINNEDLYSNYHLVIAGKGEWYFARNEKKENKVIRINRFIEDAEIKYLFKKAACVVYPYISATQSGVLSIAYYFQTPTVVSDVEYFKENVESHKTGFIFAQNNNVDIYKNIKLALSLNETMKNKLASEQKNAYLNKYSESQLRKDLVAIYKKISTIL